LVGLVGSKSCGFFLIQLVVIFFQRALLVNNVIEIFLFLHFLSFFYFPFNFVLSSPPLFIFYLFSFNRFLRVFF
jgi:hypothetical protein